MSQTQAVREIIEQLNAKICEWYAPGNVNAVAEVLAEDCWQMPPHAEPLVARVALREFWKQAAQWVEWRFTLETQGVGPVAVERGSYILEFSAGPAAPRGLASTGDRGNYLVVWRRDQLRHLTLKSTCGAARPGHRGLGRTLHSPEALWSGFSLSTLGSPLPSRHS